MFPNASTNFTPISTRSNQSLVFVSVGLAVMITASAGHTLVFLAMYRRKHLRIVPNFLILNLSVADFLFCIFTLPKHISYYWGTGKPTEILCSITGFGMVLFATASVNTLVFVSIERYVATNYPFQHRYKFTVQLIKTVLICIWFISALESALPFIASRYVYIKEISQCVVDWTENISTTLAYIIFGIVLPLLALLYCNLHVLRACKRNRETIRGAISVRLRRERQISIIIITVILIFLVCWTPYSVVMICLSTGKCAFPQVFGHTAKLMAASNSACNPIIYGIMNKNFRRAFGDILCFR